MNSNFPRTLSLLRKEKGISQKQAAGVLKVSQALLSHYENGVREPGLRFVADAADFYGVTTDFLLGRTMSRDGSAINVDELYDEAESRDNRLRGSATLLVSKKILVNSVGVLLDLAGKFENRELPREAYNYLIAAIYKLFRQVYDRAGLNSAGFFSVDKLEFSDGSDAELKLAELRFKRALMQEGELPEISNDSLTGDYPLLYQSLLSLVHTAEKNIAAAISED